MCWKRIRSLCRPAFFCFLLLSPDSPGSEPPSSCYEYFSNPWSLVGLKDYKHGTRISPDGSLVLADGAKFRFLSGESYSPLPKGVVQELEKFSFQLSGLFRPDPDVAAFDAALPIVHLRPPPSAGLSYEVIVFSSPIDPADEASYDRPTKGENYLNHICIQVRSELPRSVKAPVGVSFSRAISAPQAVQSAGEGDRYLCQENGKLALLFGVPKGASMEKVGDSLHWKVELPAEGTAELYLVLPNEPLAVGESLPDIPLLRRRTGADQATVSPGGAAYFAVAYQRTKNFWQAFLRQGGVLGVPEEKPSLAYYASLVYTFIGRDNTVIKPGEGFYDNFYLRDGAFQTHAIDLAGFTSAARESLAHFPRFQKPNGQFISQQGELDGNGQALWALYAHYALTGDTRWLGEVYPAATKAVSWLESSRQTRVRIDSPHFGILFSSIADGESLMQTPKHIVGYDFWNLRGVDCVARMAKALRKESDALEYRRLYEVYKACIEKALVKAGADWFPPSYEGVGTSWGNLTMLHPTPLFDPTDARVTATLDRVRAGFVEGTIRWSPETMRVIHPYMSTYVTNAEILRGERKEAVDHFYHFLAHTTSTHGFPEGVHYENRTAWSDTVPHLWAAAQYIILLRNMLLHEEADVLHLMPAVPAAWLRPGKKIVLIEAPTAFGKIGFMLRCDEKGGEARFSWPRRRTPERVVLHLPPGTTLTRAVGNDEKEIPLQGDLLVLPSGCEKMRIEWVLPPQEEDRTFEHYAKEYSASSPLR